MMVEVAEVLRKATDARCGAFSIEQSISPYFLKNLKLEEKGIFCYDSTPPWPGSSVGRAAD